VHLTLTLGLDLSIAGREGWDKSESFNGLETFNCRETFNCDVAQDLASASGLASANFRIKDVSPGMIVLDVEVMPDPFAPEKHLMAAKDLANQAVNTASKLRSGKITSRTVGVEVRHCKAADVRDVASLRNAPAEKNPGFCIFYFTLFYMCQKCTSLLYSPLEITRADWRVLQALSQPRSSGMLIFVCAYGIPKWPTTSTFDIVGSFVYFFVVLSSECIFFFNT
jgi:hypothetical protein